MSEERLDNQDQIKQSGRMKLGFLIFLILIGIGVSAYFIYWASQYPPKRVSLIARDWEEIWFKNSSESSSLAYKETLGVDFAGGGVIDGQTQYMRSWASGIHSRYPYTSGINEIYAENVNITLFDLSQFAETGVFYDDERSGSQATSINQPTFDYGMDFLTEDGNVVNFYSPFQIIPSELSETTIYQSSNLITLTIKSRNRESSFPYWELVTSESSLWSWNLRQNCTMNINRRVEIQRNIRDPIGITQDCSNGGDFSLEASNSPSEGSYIDFLVTNTILLRLNGYDVYANGLKVSSENSKQHAVLINGRALIKIEPTDAMTNLEIIPESSESLPEYAILRLFPNLVDKSIRLRGATGKLAVGIDSFAIDEISDIWLKYESSQPIFITDRIIVDENGAQKNARLLFVEGTMSEVNFNGEEMIAARWEQLPSDVQGAIIGAFIASLFTLIGWLGSSWISERRQQPEPLQPIINLNPTFQLPPQPIQPDVSKSWFMSIRTFFSSLKK